MGIAETLQTNLRNVREQIAEACVRAGRTPESVRLVAVTKYVDANITAELCRAGAVDLGENRPQVLEEKAKTLAELNPRWHLIGHLQRNKIRKVLPNVHLLHSGDSLRLLEAVNEVANETGRQVDILLEVNISGEPNKEGFSCDDLRGAIPRILELGNLRVRGLMGMSGLESSPAEKRAQFAQLRELREQLLREHPSAAEWTELSMGMSDDFSEAIAEGSTIVRIGSALFAGIR